MGDFRSRFAGVATAMAFLLGSAVGQAEPVAVTNPSFEDTVLSNGDTTLDEVSGWSFAVAPSSSLGEFNPTTEQFPNVPDGENVAYINGFGSTISQVVGVPLVAGAVYDLQVDIGRRRDCCGFAGADIQLRAGGTVLASTASPNPGAGQLVTVAVSFETPPSHPDLGQPIEIVLIAPGGNAQTLFDNIRLDATGLAPPNQAPQATLTIEQIINVGADALVTVSGLDSLDPDGDELTFRWTVDDDPAPVCEGTAAACGVVDVLLDIGLHEITLRVTDPDGLFDEAGEEIDIDPASLSVLAIDEAEVEFDDSPGEIELRGTVGLPVGVDFGEIEPLSSVLLVLAGTIVVPDVLVAHETEAGDPGEWEFGDKRADDGIRRFDIDWRGARFRFKERGFPIRLKSRAITSSETVLAVKLKARKFAGPVTMTFVTPGAPPATVEFAADGRVISSTVPYDEEKRGKKVTLTLPFPLLFASVIYVTGGVSRDIFVGGGLENALGRFRLDVAFDSDLFPDGAGTLPRSLDLELTIGAQGFPGEVSLGESDLEVDDDEWETEEEDD